MKQIILATMAVAVLAAKRWGNFDHMIDKAGDAIAETVDDTTVALDPAKNGTNDAFTEDAVKDAFDPGANGTSDQFKSEGQAFVNLDSDTGYDNI